jgi:hypothetical protein
VLRRRDRRRAVRSLLEELEAEIARLGVEWDRASDEERPAVLSEVLALLLQKREMSRGLPK